MADDTAFFRFDTNLGQIVSEIEQGMARINRATTATGAGRAQQQNIDIGGLSGFFGSVQDAATNLQTQMRSLIQDVGSRRISPQEFSVAARDLVRGTMVDAQRSLQSEFRNIPASTRRTLDFTDVMRGVVGDIYQTAASTLRTYRGEAGGLLAGARIGRPGELMERIATRPFAGGPGDEVGALAYRSFLEDLVRQSPSGFGAVRGVEERLGIGPELAALRNQLVIRDSQTGNIVGVRKTSTKDDLKEQLAVEKAAAAANKEHQKAQEGATKATNAASAAAYTYEQRLEALRLAQRLAAGEVPGHRLPSGSFLADSGRAYVPGAGGMLVADPNQAAKVQAEYDKVTGSLQKLNEEQAHYQRLQREGMQIGRSVNYITPDATVLRDLGDGRARMLVGEEHTRALQDYGRHLGAIEAQERRVIATREREAHRAASQESFLGGFMGRFHRGDADFTAGLGSQIASAAAFSFAYGSLFAIQAALRDTLAEVVDYQDSLTDLEVATLDADNVTGDWINTLSEMSRLTGENVGVALDTAARGVRAFGDAARQTRAEIEDVGSATNEAATKLALIANKPLADATGDVISVGTAFGLDPDQLDQITDAVANAKRSLGGDPSQIAQGLSLVAITAQKAGYSLNEAAAVMSLVQARTDQSGQAIATRLSRIFQIISGSTGKNLARELGVDTTQSIKEQIEDFAQLYTDGSPAVQDRISSALGGTANLRELLPLLQEQTRLQDAYRSALENAGQGTDEFNRKTQNLVGQLKQVKGTISNIQVDLARSGIFTPAALALDVINPALQGLDRLIRMYDDLTGRIPAVQEILAVTIELFLAAKAVSAISAANGAFGLGRGRRGAGGAVNTALAVEIAAAAQGVRLSGAQRVAVERSFNASIAQAAGQRRAAEAAATGAALTGAGGGFFGKIKGGLGTLGRFATNPVTIGVGALLGGLALTDYIGDTQDQDRSLTRQANDGLKAFARVDGSSESLRRAAQDLNATIGKLAKTDANSGNITGRDADVEGLKRNQEYLAKAAEKVAAEEAEIARQMERTSRFGDGVIETVGELGSGLEDLAASGANAITMARELREALRSEAPVGGGVNFRKDATVARIVSDLYGALGPAVRRVAPDGLNLLGGPNGNDISIKGTPLPTEVSADQAVRRLRGEVDPTLLDMVLRQQIEAMGLTEQSVLTPEQERALIEATARSMNLALTPEKAAEIRAEAVRIALSQAETDQGLFDIGGVITGGPLVDAMREAGLVNKAADRVGLLNGRGKLRQDQILALFKSVQDETGAYTGIEETFTNELQAIPESDDGSQLRRTLRQQVRFGNYLRRRGGGDLPQVVADFFAQTEGQLKQAVDDRLEQLRKVAQSAGGLSKKDIRRIGRDFLFRRLRNAQGDVNLMIQVMEDANQQALDLFRQTLVNAFQVAKAAAAAQTTFFGQLAAIAQVGTAFAALKQFDYARSGAVVGVDPNAGMLGGEGAATYEPEGGAAKTAEEKAQEALQKRRDAAALAGAKAQAAAARRGGSLASSRAQLTSAAAALRAEQKGTTEWYQALGQWYEARRGMQDAVLEYRYTLDQLKGDITDPVEQARDALRNARRTLGAHRRAGAGADVLAQDRLAERQAQAALQAEKFQQRLSDMQTAEELGRISFRKYINYLDNEHDRLSKIKNRTRQQQDQLDEVDRAMKEAMGRFEGQFNLGNINVNGLVYKARRYIAEQRVARDAAQVSASTSVVNQQDVSIQIDGADTAKVRKIIEEYVGGAGRVRGTAPRRRR